MNDFTNTVTSKSLTLKLWRGERMCLLGMDVTNPEPDFVGFSIEVRSPGSPGLSPCATALHSRIQPPPHRRPSIPSSFLRSKPPSKNSDGSTSPRTPSPERTTTALPNSTCPRTEPSNPAIAALLPSPSTPTFMTASSTSASRAGTLNGRLVDDHFGGDVRQFTSLPRFHLLSHRLKAPLHSVDTN